MLVRLRLAMSAMGISFLETYFWMICGCVLPPAIGISVLEEVLFLG